MLHLGEVDSIHGDEFLALLVAVVAELAHDIEKEHLHLAVALLKKHACHGKGISAIVTGAGHHHYALAGQETGDYLAAQSPRGSLHQVDGVDVLSLAGGIVDLSYNVRSKYFHNPLAQERGDRESDHRHKSLLIKCKISQPPPILQIRGAFLTMKLSMTLSRQRHERG